MVNPGLRQINTRYDPVEDRLVLAITSGGGDEIRLWLTRRCVILLLEMLGRLAGRFAESRGGAPLVRDALAEMAQGQAIADADLGTPFAGGSQHPLGETPLLVAKIQHGELQKENPAVRLTLLPQQGRGVNLVLDEKLTHVLTHLLKEAAQRATWRLPADETPTRPASGGKALLH